MLVPTLFQALVALHGVDPASLEDELQGRVRTRTWPSGPSGTPRRELATLPDRFPPFKAVADKGRLRIENMRLTDAAQFASGATYNRLTLLDVRLPDTVLAALEGRRLGDLLEHDALARDIIIRSVREETGPGKGRNVVLDLDMQMVELGSDPGITPRQWNTPEPPDLLWLISRTHVHEPRAPVMPEAMRTDPRQWIAWLGQEWRIVGIRNERSTVDGSAVVAIRFPYDREQAGAIGKGGFGAWFDRSSYSWRIAPHPTGLSGLSEFLAAHVDVVVDPDGNLHLPNRE